MQKNKSLKQLAVAAVFAALIAVFIAWFLHIPIKIGSNGAFLHFGDAFIFIAASLLPAPYACAAAAIGGALGDLFCGAAVWMPFTAVIKAVISLCFTSKNEKILCKRNIIAFLPALLITVAGYYIAEALIYGDWKAPLLSVTGNVVQIAGSAVIYVILGLALQKADIKKRFFK